MHAKMRISAHQAYVTAHTEPHGASDARNLATLAGSYAEEAAHRAFTLFPELRDAR